LAQHKRLCFAILESEVLYADLQRAIALKGADGTFCPIRSHREALHVLIQHDTKAITNNIPVTNTNLTCYAMPVGTAEEAFVELEPASEPIY